MSSYRRSTPPSRYTDRRAGILGAMASRMAGIEPAFPDPLPLDEVPARFRELIGLDVTPEQVDFTTAGLQQAQDRQAV